MKHFKEYEFKCKCGKCDKGFKDMNPGTLKKLELAREYSAAKLPGTVFILNSAIRCPEHNKRVGGSDTSSHLTGHAVDIRSVSSEHRHAVIFGLVSAGFNRIGVGKTFIHVDDDPYKTLNTMWVYK